MIQQVNDTTFKTTNRGNEMTLFCGAFGWTVSTDNASARAWNRGRASMKHFDTLKQVEQHYKAFRGITALVNAA